MDITCNVIRDLLPLHIDKLTSADSDELISAHLTTCPDCNHIYSELTSTMDTAFVSIPPTPAPKAEKHLIGRIRRHIMLSKLAFIALGTFFGMYATTKGQLQAPFLVYPLIGIAGEVLIGGIWVTPIAVFVFNSIASLFFWGFHFGVVQMSAILAILTLMGSLIAYSAKRVFE